MSGSLRVVLLAFPLLLGLPTARSAAQVQGNPRVTHQRAAEAWERGDTETAGELYRDLLAADSTDGLALNRLALISGWNGEYEEALRLFHRLLELEPTNYDARVSRARVLAWKGDTSAALESLDRILESDPGNLQALEARAQIQTWVGEQDAALSSYQELLGISEDPTGILLAQARVLGSASQVREAREVYQDILARDPGNFEAQKGLARTLTWGGYLPEGEEAWRLALASSPGDPASRAGLVQNLRWQGRNAAAREVLNEAGSGPTGAPELEEQLAWVDAALSPRAWVTLVREGDSDDNRMTTAQFRGRWNPIPHLSVHGEAYTRELKQTGIDLSRSSWGVNINASLQLEPGWSLTAGAGGTETDGSGRSSFTSFRAGLTTPVRNRLGGSIQLSRHPLDVTAQLVERGVRVETVDLSGRWTPAPGWQLSGTAGAGTYHGGEENQRIHFRVQATRGMRGGWTLGVSHRYFGFDEDLDDFYFDPDYFGLTELMAKGAWETGRWGLLLEFSPGAQKIRSEGDYSAALRASARVSYRLAPGRVLSLSGGYSSAGLQSFSTGDSDYRYRALVLGGSWVF
ncbi:MAG: tetratricopeptide repeat protein [Gemmatimonadota bacterium]|jgi:tetratricopeptide (TPR) repeat protein